MKKLLACIALTVAVCYLGNQEQPAPAAGVPRETVQADTSYNLQHLAFAIAQIESKHNPKARRFEPILFERMTGKRCSTIAQAERVNWRAAMLATSHGKYQILGSNWRACGYGSLVEMVRATEREQDVAFVRFAVRARLDSLTKGRQWERIARIYNGKGYRRNRYAEKLRRVMESQKV